MLNTTTRTAMNVEESDRLSFLPHLFDSTHLPSGGGHMMPDSDRFLVVNGENWFDRIVIHVQTFSVCTAAIPPAAVRGNAG